MTSSDALSTPDCLISPSGSGDIMIISLCLALGLTLVHYTGPSIPRSVSHSWYSTLLSASHMFQYTTIISPEKLSLSCSRSSSIAFLFELKTSGYEVTLSKNEDINREKKAVFVGFDIHIFIWRAQNKITKTCSEEIRSHQRWKWQGRGHSHFFVEPFLQN